MANQIHVHDLPSIKHQSSFFRDGFLSMLVIGKSGSGKTRLLTSILPGVSKAIKTVIIATIVKGAPFHEAIKDYFRKKGVYCYISGDPTQLTALVDYLHENEMVNLDDQGLIIFDDFNDGKMTPGSPYMKFTTHAFTKLRNYGWNFIIIAQQPQFLPTIIRNNVNTKILFDCATKIAIQTFLKDVMDRVEYKDVIDTLIRYIQEKKYKYIMIREGPFEVSAGTLDQFKPVLTERTVQIPTLNEIKRELGVRTKEELDRKTKYLQKEAGNTAHELDYDSDDY